MKGTLKQRSKGSWSIILDVGRDLTTGKRRQQRVTVRGAKKDAERRLRELLTQVDQGLPVDNIKVTLRDYLASWLRDVVSVRNAPRIQDAYSTIVNKHIVTALGHLPLNKVSPADVERLEVGLMANGLSPNTVHHVHVVLSKAFADAMRKAMIHYNPCRMVQAPRPGRYEVNVPEAGIIRKILERAWDTPYGVIFHFMAYTGVRRGEAVGLKWEHVDLERGVISIVQTAQRIGKRGILIQPPKSTSGRRGIALDSETIAILREHRGRQLLYAMELEGAFNNKGYVFPGPFGEVLDPSVVSRNFKRIRDNLGYPSIRLHDLRHAHAAGMVKANIHPLVIQKRLGHASAAFTMQVYGHLSAGLQREAAQSFADLMKGKEFSNP